MVRSKAKHPTQHRAMLHCTGVGGGATLDAPLLSTNAGNGDSQATLKDRPNKLIPTVWLQDRVGLSRLSSAIDNLSRLSSAIDSARSNVLLGTCVSRIGNDAK